MGGLFAVSFGGNLRNTRRAFERALRILFLNRNIICTGCSPVVRTEPWEIISPSFQNMVVTGYSRIGAPGLWDLLVRVERREIRRGKGKLYPRTLDLDFLYFKGPLLPRRNLILPHPRLEVRPVLRDLLDRSEKAPRSSMFWLIRRSTRDLSRGKEERGKRR